MHDSRPSTTLTTCPWQGAGRYLHLEVDRARNEDAAWYYPEPKAPANIAGRVAFSKAVQVEG